MIPSVIIAAYNVQTERQRMHSLDEFMHRMHQLLSENISQWIYNNLKANLSFQTAKKKVVLILKLSEQDIVVLVNIINMEASRTWLMARDLGG